MRRRNRRPPGRPAVRLSEHERVILIHWYANPDFTPQQLTAALGLCPGELSRLRRHRDGRELVDSLLAMYAPRDFWPEYRLAKCDGHRLRPSTVRILDAICRQALNVQNQSRANDVLAELGYSPTTKHGTDRSPRAPIPAGSAAMRPFYGLLVVAGPPADTAMTRWRNHLTRFTQIFLKRNPAVQRARRRSAIGGRCGHPAELPHPLARPLQRLLIDNVDLDVDGRGAKRWCFRRTEAERLQCHCGCIAHLT